MRRAVWWLLFVICGIWLQELIPGADFLAAGVLICLQKERWLPAFWLTLCFILIQEGSGNLAFGSSLLMYAGLAAAFFLGRILLEPLNPVFIILFSLFLGAWHSGVLFVLVGLQSLTLPTHEIIRHGVVMAIGLPLFWGGTYALYKWYIPSPSHV